MAYLRRMRYGVKSEALSPEQRQLLEDDTLEKLPVWTMRRIDELLPIKHAA